MVCKKLPYSEVVEQAEEVIMDALSKCVESDERNEFRGVGESVLGVVFGQ